MASSGYEVSDTFTLDLIDEVPCPRCDKTLRVPKDHSGKIMCPNCEWKFQFPLPPEVDREVREDTSSTSSGNILLDIFLYFVYDVGYRIVGGIILLFCWYLFVLFD